MLAAQGVNWTQVLIYGVPAIISAAFSGVAVVIGASNRRALKTPSGDPIGHVVERTHDLAAVSTLAVTGVTADESMKSAARRLNADAGSPVKVNGEILPEAAAGNAPSD